MIKFQLQTSQNMKRLLIQNGYYLLRGKEIGQSKNLRQEKLQEDMYKKVRNILTRSLQK
jgi:hypothetical protein